MQNASLLCENVAHSSSSIRKHVCCANQEWLDRMHFYFNASVNRISVIDSESMDNVYCYKDFDQSYVECRI